VTKGFESKESFREVTPSGFLLHRPKVSPLYVVRALLCLCRASYVSSLEMSRANTLFTGPDYRTLFRCSVTIRSFVSLGQTQESWYLPRLRSRFGILLGTTLFWIAIPIWIPNRNRKKGCTSHWRTQCVTFVTGTKCQIFEFVSSVTCSVHFSSFPFIYKVTGFYRHVKPSLKVN